MIHQNHYLCSKCNHENMWHWLDGKGCNGTNADKCTCTGFKSSGRYTGQEDDERQRAFVQRLIARWVLGELKPMICTNATRPPAEGLTGVLAYNTDAGDFEASDGVNWRDKDGVIT